MTRIAFKMKLFPGYAAEYKQRHAAIWPELAALLKSAGVKDYSIFLDEETLLLFAYLQIEDPAELGSAESPGYHVEVVGSYERYYGSASGHFSCDETFGGSFLHALKIVTICKLKNIRSTPITSH